MNKKKKLVNKKHRKNQSRLKGLTILSLKKIKPKKAVKVEKEIEATPPKAVTTKKKTVKKTTARKAVTKKTATKKVTAKKTTTKKTTTKKATKKADVK